MSYDQWLGRRQVEVEKRLRRRDVQSFPGNPGGRSAVTRPLQGGGQSALLGGVTSNGTGTLLNPTPELIRWRVDAESIASGGHTVVFDTEVCREGFADTAAGPGSSLQVQFDGFLLVTVAVLFDTYTAGAIVRVLTNAGTADEVEQLTLPASGFNTTGYGLITGACCVFRGSPVTVTVTQSSGVAELASVRLDVVGVRRVLERPVAGTALTLAALSDVSWTEETAITAISPSASGGAGSYIWSATGLPSSVTINSSTGQISGTPDAGTAASSPYTVTVMVMDSVGQQASQTFTATVEATATVNMVILGTESSFGGASQGITYNAVDAVCYVRTAQGLAAVDTSDPATPTITNIVTSSTQLNGAGGVAYDAANDLCYVAASANDRLTVVDVSNPAALSIVGSVASALMEEPGAVAYDSARSLCYVTGRTANRLVVIDVSTPAAPSVLGSVLSAADLEVASGVTYDAANQLCYVAALTSQALTVVDVSTPASPAVVGSVSGVALDGAFRVAYSPSRSRCYVASFFGDSVTVVDVSTPSAPSILGSISSSTDLDQARGIAYDETNDQCYVTPVASDKLVVVDVSTPSTPTITNTLAMSDPNSVVYDSTLGFCFVTRNNAMSVVDIFAP